jgi:hypothetical protein
MTTLPAVSARFRLAAVAAVAAGTLALAGCQGATPGGTETTTAVATPSATPAPTPTPTAVYKPADAQGKAQNVPVPVKPALADENSKAGLEAFVGYWFALLNYGYETGDLSAWNEVTSPTCVFCSRLKAGVESGYQGGGWLVGGRLSTPNVDVRFSTDGSPQQVVIQVIHSPIEYYKADGSARQPTSTGSNSATVLNGTHRDGGWHVSDLNLLK